MLPIACSKKDDYRLLKQAFASRNAAPARQAQILKDYGVQWSTLNVLPNWGPSSKTALDFMHNIYLGVIAHFFTQVLFAAPVTGFGPSLTGPALVDTGLALASTGPASFMTDPSSSLSIP